MKIKHILLSGLAAVTAMTSAALTASASEIYSYKTSSYSEPTTGVEVDYHTQNQIRSYLESHPFSTSSSAGYSTSPDLTSPYENAGALNTTTLTQGLNALNCMRYIAGLPEVSLDSSYSSQCQSGSYVNYLNGTISHTPTKPAGISDSIYNTGSSACGKSNLGMGYTNIADSIVRGYMDDSDSSNISRLGHRRWCLNPSMQKTGFGQVGRFQSMYAFDNSFGATAYTGVCWPAQNMPLEYFGNDQAWSYSLGEEITNTSQIRVTLTNLSNNKKWSFSEASSDGVFYIENSNYGKQGCVIFRPNNITYNAGDEFLVEIKRLWDDGLYSTIAQYTVDFFGLSPNVTGLKATVKYPDSLKFTWNSSGNNASYVAEIFLNNVRVGYSPLLTTNSYTFKNLKAMTEYRVKVTAFYGTPIGCDGDYTGNSGTPQQLSIITPYGVNEVSDLKAASTSNTVKLSWSWNKKYTYDKFKVDVYKGGKWVNAGTTTGTSFTVKSLNPSTSYKFRVTSLGANRTSATGLTYGGTSHPVTVSATTKLPPVANLKGTTTANSVKLTWSKYNSASFYRVWIWKSGKWTKLTQTTNNTTLNYTAKSLAANTSYKFRVTAYNKSGKAIAYSDITQKTKCGKIANLKATPTNSSVKLTWSKNTSASYYKVWVWKNSKWTKLTQTKSNATVAYTAKSLKANTSYKFRVTAYNKSGKAIAYTDITSKTKAKIANLKAAPAKNSIKLTWNKNTSAKYYKVFIWKSGKWTQLTQTKSNTTVAYTAKNLKANTSYKFRVTAYNKSGKAIAYSDITVKTKR